MSNFHSMSVAKRRADMSPYSGTLDSTFVGLVIAMTNECEREVVISVGCRELDSDWPRGTVPSLEGVYTSTRKSPSVAGSPLWTTFFRRPRRSP